MQIVIKPIPCNLLEAHQLVPGQAYLTCTVDGDVVHGSSVVLAMKDTAGNLCLGILALGKVMAPSGLGASARFREVDAELTVQVK